MLLGSWFRWDKVRGHLIIQTYIARITESVTVGITKGAIVFKLFERFSTTLPNADEDRIAREYQYNS